MLDKRGRDIGEPTHMVCYAEATPEKVATTRLHLEKVLERHHTRINGYPTKCTVQYAAEKPAGYGIPHGDPPPY